VSRGCHSMPRCRRPETRVRSASLFFSPGSVSGARSNSIIIPPAVMPLRIRERANKCIIHPCGIMKARARERSHYHERMDGRSPCESLLIRSLCSFECRKRTRETFAICFLLVCVHVYILQLPERVFGRASHRLNEH